jgi:hypothetical protein
MRKIKHGDRFFIDGLEYKVIETNFGKCFELYPIVCSGNSDDCKYCEYKKSLDNWGCISKPFNSADELLEYLNLKEAKKMSEKAIPEHLNDLLSEEAKKGNVVNIDIEGSLVFMPLKSFIDQPLIGILYDLDLLPESIFPLTQSASDAIKKYATYQCITELKKQLEELKEKGQKEEK